MKKAAATNVLLDQLKIAIKCNDYLMIESRMALPVFEYNWHLLQSKMFKKPSWWHSVDVSHTCKSMFPTVHYFYKSYGRKWSVGATSRNSGALATASWSSHFHKSGHTLPVEGHESEIVNPCTGRTLKWDPSQHRISCGDDRECHDEHEHRKVLLQVHAHFKELDSSWNPSFFANLEEEAEAAFGEGDDVDLEAALEDFGDSLDDDFAYVLQPQPSADLYEENPDETDFDPVESYALVDRDVVNNNDGEDANIVDD